VGEHELPPEIRNWFSWSRAGSIGAARRGSTIGYGSCSPTLARTVYRTGGADFVWGEDAWCYVLDKAKLISEAARLV